MSLREEVMSELSLSEMLFMHVIIGISIVVIANVAIAIIFFSFLLIGTFIYVLITDKFREIPSIVQEFFYPTPMLPADVRERILREAADFVRAKHRPWHGDDLFAEYLWVGPERLRLAWKKMYGKKEL